MRETRRVPQTDTALEALAGDRLGGHSRSLDSHLLLWRMMRVWLTRNRELLFPAITVLIAFFLLANLVKHGILAPSALAANKDALSALNSTVNVIVIIFGAIFSYYRFFRGRTFFARADVDIGVTLLPYDCRLQHSRDNSYGQEHWKPDDLGASTRGYRVSGRTRRHASKPLGQLEGSAKCLGE